MQETKFFDHFMMCYYNENYGTNFECFSQQVSEFIELEPLYMLDGILIDIDYIKKNIEIPKLEEISNFSEHRFWRKFHRSLSDNRVEYLEKEVKKHII